MSWLLVKAYPLAAFLAIHTRGTWVELFSNGYRPRTLVLWVAWFATYFAKTARHLCLAITPHILHRRQRLAGRGLNVRSIGAIAAAASSGRPRKASQRRAPMSWPRKPDEISQLISTA
jgi:hypothetical protein